MTTSLLNLVNAACAQTDTIRKTMPFSSDLASASEALWSAVDDSARAQALSDWIRRHQPCLFGQIAAKNNMIGFCFITESDIKDGEGVVNAKIQQHRLDWLNRAREGHQHAFILLLVSRSLSMACPSDKLKKVALRLASLYLEEDVAPDSVCVDHVFLSLPASPQPELWLWPAGVNVFCAQGDGRWWRDHRIPGGLAFSVNSVGHMVKSATWKSNYQQYSEAVGLSGGVGPGPKVESLERALELAMRTIAGASEAVSGRATWLEHKDDADSRSVRGLEDYSSMIYGGYYHTDHTVPSCYFRSGVKRPTKTPSFSLDFSYLHGSSVENIDSIRIGAGRRIMRFDTLRNKRLEGLRLDDVPDQTITAELLRQIRRKIAVS